MLRFMELNRVQSNMRFFVQYIDSKLLETESLRDSYFSALNSVQKTKLVWIRNSNTVQLLFDHSDPLTAGLLCKLMNIENLGEENALSNERVNHITEQFGEAIQLIQLKNAALGQLFELLVGNICFAKLKGLGGASFGDTLGAFWLNPPKSWKSVDYSEAIVHETTHQALFLEQMVNGMYTVPASEFGNEENLVLSAIRKVKRPFDLSWHSVTVAVALAEFYSELGDKSKASSFAGPARTTLDEFKSKKDLLSTTGLDILDDLDSRCQAFELAPIS
jgi:hypothetical protein